MSSLYLKGWDETKPVFNIYGTKIKTRLNHLLLRSKAFL